jgi:hypothetical protein
MPAAAQLRSIASIPSRKKKSWLADFIATDGPKTNPLE